MFSPRILSPAICELSKNKKNERMKNYQQYISLDDKERMVLQRANQQIDNLKVFWKEQKKMHLIPQSLYH